MIEERKDFDLLVEATECCRDFSPIEDLVTWIEMPRNYMLVSDGDVGLATFEYPGLYNVHWFFKSRGREAIEVAKAMLTHMIEHHDAEAFRGLIKPQMKASKWACRQVGFQPLGMIKDKSGIAELFYMHKKDLING